MTHRDQEGRRDPRPDYGRDPEQARQRQRYGRERSDYESPSGYNARVQRHYQGYEGGPHEYYTARPWDDRSQNPAWMEENRSWEYEGGPERVISEEERERWNLGSARERGAYGTGTGGYYYGERQRYGTQGRREYNAAPDLGYGMYPSHPREQPSGRGPFGSGRSVGSGEYGGEYGTHSVYGGESAGSGGRGSLYSGEYMGEAARTSQDQWLGSLRQDRATGRYAASRGSGMSPGYRGVGPKNYRRSDERLTEEINERLTDDDYLDASGITVRVSDAKVTLEGSVDQRWMKHLAEDIADACSGVKEVDNRITVAPGSEALNRSASTPRTTTTSTTPGSTTGPGAMPH